MKKLLLSLLIICMLFSPIVSFAAGEKTYEVPVKLMHAFEAGKESMGNKALKQSATVVVANGKTTYKLHLKPMEFMNLTGQLTNLFIYDTDGNSNRTEANVTAIQKEGYTKEFSFTRNGGKEDTILVAVWVDAMDQLSGGTPGAGEQKAKLVFDWSKANEAKGGLLDNIGKQPPAKKALTIKVNGKEIKPDTPAFIESDRTMVPVRFISEALGLKVGWNNAERKVLVGEGKDLVTLKIGSKEIVKADGSKVAIDAPAMIRNERTFVPLRAIAEISGAKVDWDNTTRTAIINK